MTLSDKSEQVETTLKLEKTENLKIQYVSNNQKTTSFIGHVQKKRKIINTKYTQKLST